MAQIGTIKLETQNSGVVNVPVFATGDSASGVYEFVRVETASGTGFIPVTDPADATYPYLRVQSQNNGIVAVTDTAGSDIPDSEDLQAHYDFSQEDGSLPVTDQSSQGNDLTNGAFSGVGTSINGVQAGEFDGINDGLVDPDPTGSQFNSVHMVVDCVAQTDVFMYVMRSTSSLGHIHFVSQGFGGASDEWGLENAIYGGSTTTTPAVLSFIITESPSSNATATVRQNGSEVVSGTLQGSFSGPLDEAIELGFDDSTSGRNWAGSIGEMMVYPGVDSARTSAVESYLADRWGITLS